MLKQSNHRQQRKEPVRVRPPDASHLTASEATDALAENSLPPMPRWLSVDQVRKLQRMRRETVHCAMQNGELPFERRGRICYIRLSDVVAWEQRRIKPAAQPVSCLIHPDLAGFLGGGAS